MISIKSKVVLRPALSSRWLVCLLGIVPSSTHSSSTAASPLPSQFIPLLGDSERSYSACHASGQETLGIGGGWIRGRRWRGRRLREGDVVSRLLTFCSVICNIHGLSYSDANPSNIQAPRGHMWTHRNGSTICRRCCAAWYGSISHPKLGIGYSHGWLYSSALQRLVWQMVVDDIHFRLWRLPSYSCL